MARKSSIITVEHIDSNSESFDPGYGNDLIFNVYRVVKVEGEKPRLVIGPIFGDDKALVKVVRRGENISEGEICALENSGMIVEYFHDFID